MYGNCGENLARLAVNARIEAARLTEKDERDAARNLFALDDQDLAALALRPAAGVVIGGLEMVVVRVPMLVRHARVLAEDE